MVATALGAAVIAEPNDWLSVESGKGNSMLVD